MANNAQSTAWVHQAAQAINEATNEAELGSTVNVTINIDNSTVNNDYRQVIVNNGRSRLPTIREAQALCSPSRQRLTGYSATTAALTMAELNAMWDAEIEGRDITAWNY